MPRVLDKYNLKMMGITPSVVKEVMDENALLKSQIPKGHISTTSTQLTDSAEDMPIEHVKIKGATSQAILPTGYTQIDYIESTGTQYIDTNYTPVQGDSFEFKNVSFTPNSNSQTLFSAGTDDYQLIFKVAVDHIYFKYFSTGSATALPLSSFNNANIRINNNGEVYINDVLKATVNYGGAVNTSLNLFRRANNVEYINAKIGEIIISNNNIIKKHYIPAQRNSDNAVGLYEIVGNTFYNNGGTGTFSKGNEVPNPSYRQDIHVVTGNCNVKFKNSDATAEQNAPLSLGNEEYYEGDEIQISYVQKAGYKKVTGANKVKNMGKKTFSNEDVFYSVSEGYYMNFKVKATTPRTLLCNRYVNKVTYSTFMASDYAISMLYSSTQLYIRDKDVSSASELLQKLINNNTEIIYKLATPVIAPITDTTFLAQLETLINLKTYKETTNIESTGADLAPVIDFEYYQDMSTLNDRLDELEARIELLEE